MANKKQSGKPGGLMLSRKTGESIKIDGSMTITVVEIKRGLVRLQFNGHQQVLRAEIYDAKFSAPSAL